MDNPETGKRFFKRIDTTCHPPLIEYIDAQRVSRVVLTDTHVYVFFDLDSEEWEYDVKALGGQNTIALLREIGVLKGE